MNLEEMEKKIRSVFNLYETGLEIRIRDISGMQHFVKYLYEKNIEIEAVSEKDIETYTNELKLLGYPDIFITTNLSAVRKYYKYTRMEIAAQ